MPEHFTASLIRSVANIGFRIATPDNSANQLAEILAASIVSEGVSNHC
jgi:hypothetical protein